MGTFPDVLDFGCSGLPLPSPEPSLWSLLHCQPARAEDWGGYWGPDLGPLQDIQPILGASPEDTTACVPRDNTQHTLVKGLSYNPGLLLEGNLSCATGLGKDAS